ERTTAEGQAARMQAVALNFERKVGEHGILYGSVTSMDIAEALREQGHEIDRRRITLREPIKETGEFTVSVRLHREVIVEVPVVVAPEGGAQAAPAGGETAAGGGEDTPGAEAGESAAASGESAAAGEDE
ncbi:MAG: 50S ribosomal protein L9, partial [Acidobacteria bacterium]|nr:50S ribosomal protein L9 [Acidobacteriota bacterium]